MFLNFLDSGTYSPQSCIARAYFVHTRLNIIDMPKLSISNPLRIYFSHRDNHLALIFPSLRLEIASASFV